MRLTIVSGSHRSGSQTSRVCRYLASRAHRLLEVEAPTIVDLAELPLPLVEQADPEDLGALEHWQAISAALDQATALVIATPEWGGMATPAIKNLFQLATAGEVAHKPALLVGISASLGGAYPIAELRMSSFKNTHVCYIPEHIIVRNVAHVLHGDEPESDTDLRLRARIDYALRVLMAYSGALEQVRASGTIDPRYRYGM